MDQDSFTPSGRGSVFLTDTVVSATIRSDKDIYLKGRIIGDVHCKADLYVDKGAVIKGDVSCEMLFLDGMILGDVRVARRTHLKEHAVITGCLQTSSLLIHPDAKVEKGLKLHDK